MPRRPRQHPAVTAAVINAAGGKTVAGCSDLIECP